MTPPLLRPANSPSSLLTVQMLGFETLRVCEMHSTPTAPRNLAHPPTAALPFRRLGRRAARIIHSPTFRTGESTTPSRPPSPACSKICARRTRQDDGRRGFSPATGSVCQSRRSSQVGRNAMKESLP